MVIDGICQLSMVLYGITPIHMVLYCLHVFTPILYDFAPILYVFGVFQWYLVHFNGFHPICMYIVPYN